MFWNTAFFIKNIKVLILFMSEKFMNKWTTYNSINIKDELIQQ